MNKTLCWLSFLAVVILLICAYSYPVPTVGGHYEPIIEPGDVGSRGGIVGYEWVEEKDFSQVPLYVKIGQYGTIPLTLAGIVLLVGAITGSLEGEKQKKRLERIRGKG